MTSAQENLVNLEPLKPDPYSPLYRSRFIAEEKPPARYNYQPFVVGLFIAASPSAYLQGNDEPGSGGSTSR
jgi:hypothetical protein